MASTNQNPEHNPNDELHFLTYEEAEYLQKIGLHPPGWVEDFVSWAGKQTDASPYALRGAALIALSLAAGDVVVLAPQFGSQVTYMNLYLLLIGQSTVVRKTTVISMVHRVLPKAGDGTDFVDIQDDFSIQALAQALAKAADTMRPTLLALDEVAAMFKHMKNSNNYLHGLDAVLLKSYDHSRISIIRTNKTHLVPDGAFVSLIAASPPTQMEASLSEEDITSGLLPRCMVFTLDDADGGPRVPMDERNNNQEAWEEEADGLQKRLEVITGNRLGTYAAVVIADHKQTVIPLTDEALKRLDDLDAQIRKERIDSTHTFATIKGRAQGNILKVAGLIKLSRTGHTKGKVELDDVLRSMSLAETVMGDVLALTDVVGLSRRSILLQKVEAIIRRAGGSGISTPGYIKGQLSKAWRSDLDDFPGGAAGVCHRLEAEGTVLRKGKGYIHAEEVAA